jgi:hypothetical protein
MSYLNPYSTSRRWLRGNLHAHTSCGRFMDVTESAPIYKSLGYDFLAVTDHNVAPSPETLAAWQAQTDLILIPGEENGQTDHMLEIGVHTVTETPSSHFGARSQALLDAGGFVAACHPQEYGHGEESVRNHVQSLHAFELFNGLREARGCDETRNVQLWDELLSKGERIWGIATDDFHCEYITPGHGWVCVQVPEDLEKVTWPIIVEQLKAGAFFASTYPRFQSIELEGDHLKVVADRFTKAVRVIGPQGQVLCQEQGTRLEWRVVPGMHYFRIEGVNGLKRAWSQPFFARE